MTPTLRTFPPCAQAECRESTRTAERAASNCRIFTIIPPWPDNHHPREEKLLFQSSRFHDQWRLRLDPGRDVPVSGCDNCLDNAAKLARDAACCAEPLIATYQPACKPGSVGHRRLARTRRDGHSSGTMLAHGLEQPTRTASLTSPCGVIAFANSPRCRPYSVLLPVGFAVPFPLPETRSALPVPFYP